VVPEQRVNFHIGNPIQDDRLTRLYQQLIFGLPLSDEKDLPNPIESLVVDETMEERMQFLAKVVGQSVAYLPRGGFSSREPGPLAERIQHWLDSDQEEPLDYALGLKAGRREITIVSGGPLEAIRMLFAALSKNLERGPAYLYLYHLELPPQFLQTPELRFQNLPQDEILALRDLEISVKDSPDMPHFLILGTVMNEESRRALRRMSLETPLAFIEFNDAPNHCSLGREAGLSERVLRIISSKAIHPKLWPISLAFVVGNAGFIQALETTHFELKGTPSAPEVELCAFLMDSFREEDDPSAIPILEEDHPGSHQRYLSKVPELLVERSVGITPIAQSLESLVNRVEQTVLKGAEPLERLSKNIGAWVNRLPGQRWAMDDPNAGMSASEVIQSFFERWEDPAWHAELEKALLASFLNHHPEYAGPACTVVSGSARTAFGILGRHCGIQEVVTPDLSWTYEHGFSKVTAVSLTEDLELDVQGMIETVSQRLEQASDWRDHGAVVLNNPHNASGAVFKQEDVTRLVQWLLEHGVRVIDDLSYEDVVPGDHLQDYDTVRRIVTRLLRIGSLRPEQAELVITVHSFSKTDCLAGARVAVTEILDPVIRKRFRDVTRTIRPNLTALLMVYLFYRRQRNEVQHFWTLRNYIMGERMQALKQAVEELPQERNPYSIRVEAPTGSMYPRLVVEGLPRGVSLDWLASGLAPRGIGLLPFSTFARTARGFNLARKSFRLTLGGEDGPFQLQRKTRRVLIDLNRLIEDQETLYTLKTLPTKATSHFLGNSTQMVDRRWESIQNRLETNTVAYFKTLADKFLGQIRPEDELRYFLDEYLPDRFNAIRQRLTDRANLADEYVDRGLSQNGASLLTQLELETCPVSLEEKQTAFRSRLYDRTVHPTQMYSLEVDRVLDHVVRDLMLEDKVESQSLEDLAQQIAAEYFGEGVAITSDQESEELVQDLRALIDAESWAKFKHNLEMPTLLSFWGDWDGSTRPSGQGHRLAAGALLANVMDLARLLRILDHSVPGFRMDPTLEDEVQRLEANSGKFWALLNEITRLTSQLEERYLRVLPFDVRPGFWRRLGMRMHVARDPISILWQHNDRLERRMLKLRHQRGQSLEHYFKLNEQMQQALRENLEVIQPSLRNKEVAIQVGAYRNLLKRFVLTPRIHEQMILSRDQFAIDTTVHNIVEINRLAGEHRVPGLVLALQVSMSTDPEALIALDRKLVQQRQEQLRSSSEVLLPRISVIPLFEDLDTIHDLDSYLDQVWEYAVQSRTLGQESSERFQEILSEVFFAGSDLSQQIGQPAGDALYHQAKLKVVRWLSEHNLRGSVRTKLGSGEPAQRQGGYYDPCGTGSPVLKSSNAQRRIKSYLGDAEGRAWELARSPLRGIQSGGEFRTFQSNLSERLRWLSTEERLGLLYHVWRSQRKYESELERAASALENTRLHFEEHSLRELETITKVSNSPIYQKFLDIAHENFRQILYGRDEDVVGIHVISHFASRAMPPLRDRPVIRPTSATGEGEVQRHEIVGRLARTLPLSQHGSMLRAIGHNRAQSMMLGVNQFTCGLFRAMNEFSTGQASSPEGKRALEDYVLPQLNVYDMLHSLRLYHDPELVYVRKLEITFPAGNSAFIALREDNDLIPVFVPSLQHELLRRSGLDVDDAFRNGQVKPELLPALRPEIAVLLQPDIFNTDVEYLLSIVGPDADPTWIDSVSRFLQTREEVFKWRENIWEIIEVPIRTQVESFVALALAIHSLREGEIRTAVPLVAEPAEVQRLGSQVAELLRGAADDPLRQFLVAAVQYLTDLPGTQTEVPVDVLRALRDVERIVKIEEQALGSDQQALVRHYVLKIARLCGENG
jgi:aspartate/methionine/tyrosine aminotransferase